MGAPRGEGRRHREARPESHRVQSAGLVLTWGYPVGTPEAEHSRVTFELEQLEDMVRLTVTHDQLDAEGLRGISYGWPLVLSSLKSFIETGKAINLWAWKQEMAAKK